MLQNMTGFFISAFHFPGLNWTLVLIAVALGLVFGAYWLMAYWPPLFKKPQLWLIGIIAAALTWTAIAFVQIPLQLFTGQALAYFWDQQTLLKWLLLAGIPQILLSGLVQEGSKLLPVVFLWWRNNRNISPVLGLTAGAVAGAGFGVFEAVWIHNTIFASGWTLDTAAAQGFPALLGFWERFFSVGFHIAVSALAGYGLAIGMGWQFYLIASFLHGALNYAVILLQVEVFNVIQVEIYVALFTLVLTAVVLWLRWHRNKESGQLAQS